MTGSLSQQKTILWSINSAKTIQAADWTARGESSLLTHQHIDALRAAVSTAFMARPFCPQRLQGDQRQSASGTGSRKRQPGRQENRCIDCFGKTEIQESSRSKYGYWDNFEERKYQYISRLAGCFSYNVISSGKMRPCRKKIYETGMSRSNEAPKNTKNQ